MNRTDIISENDSELTVAVCTSTYYRLNGRIPSIDELCGQLGSGYRSLVIRLMNRPAFLEAVCA